MKRQRGIVNFDVASGLLGSIATNPVVWLLGAIALVGALAGLALTVTSYLKGLERAGYERGASATKARYEARDAAATLAAKTEIDRLNAVIKEQETKGAEAIAAAQRNHMRERTNVEKERDRALADVRAGRLKLRDPGAIAACPASGELPVPAASAGATGGEQAPGAELSRIASEFLLGFAADADTLRAELKLAWDTVMEDRKICNGSPK